jgi:hypothetical protein
MAKRFQFRLRTLLIVTTVVAVTAGWLGRWIERNRRQSEIVEAITSSGGYVYFDYERWGKGWTHGPNGPGWLRSLLGENVFSEVDCVGLSDTSVSDADLPGIEKSMKELGHVTTLDVARTKISAGGAKRLKAALPNCQVLTDR